MNKNWIKKITVFSLVLGMCICAGGSILALWNAVGLTENILTLSVCRNEIVEEYQEPKQVYPSQEVSKIVNISNSGTVDTIVRVKLEKQIGTELPDGQFKADKQLNPEMIELNCNSKYWDKKGKYYYYKEVLRAGDTTKEPLLSSFRLSEEAGSEYCGKNVRIQVKMEAVQAEGNAIEAWEVTYKDLGIQASAVPKGKMTSIRYLGKEEGFDVKEGKNDLFAGFKNLLPGCARVQQILVQNDSSEIVEIFLHAQESEQEKMTTDQKRLLSQFLERYAVIEVKEGDKQIYKGPVSGNLHGSGNSMKDAVSLGSFSAKSSKKLTVNLSVDPEMDQAYEQLTGKVKWVFTVNGDRASTDPEEGTIYPAKTGEENRADLRFCIAAFFLCMCLGLFSFIQFQKERKENTCGKNC